MRILGFVMLVTGMVIFGGVEEGNVFGVGDAQARVGRPLTPMSYAGVARRTGRRAYRYGAYGGAAYGGQYYGGYAQPAYGQQQYYGQQCHC